MITPEGRVKAKVKALLNKYNVYYFMPATGGYGRSGIPDFICCVKTNKSSRGLFVAIECKAGNAKPTALQEREMVRIRQQGGSALVINEQLLDYLEGFLIGVTGCDLTSSEE